MAKRRDPLLPHEATSEGARRLRLLIRRLTFGALARALSADESTVRSWARCSASPSRSMRGKMESAPSVAIPEWTWDEPPSGDVYAGSEPETTKR